MHRDGADMTLSKPDGTPVVWADWLAERAPVAVLVWASWVPGADATLADLDRIRTAARGQGLDLVIVAVQESFGEAAGALADVKIDWVHDRYGGLLKDYRVVDIPRLLVFTADGRLAKRLDISPESLRSWGGE